MLYLGSVGELIEMLAGWWHSLGLSTCLLVFYSCCMCLKITMFKISHAALDSNIPMGVAAPYHPTVQGWQECLDAVDLYTVDRGWQVRICGGSFAHFVLSHGYVRMTSCVYPLL